MSKMKKPIRTASENSRDQILQLINALESINTTILSNALLKSATDVEMHLATNLINRNNRVIVKLQDEVF